MIISGSWGLIERRDLTEREINRALAVLEILWILNIFKGYFTTVYEIFEVNYLSLQASASCENLHVAHNGDTCESSSYCILLEVCTQN